jgi:hypothetical protein
MGMVDNCDGKKKERKARDGEDLVEIRLACVAAGQWVWKEWLLRPAL